MHVIHQTQTFTKWLKSLRDIRAKSAILRRIDRASLGHLGDCKSVGEGVREMRIDIGPGYRVYFTERNGCILLLLVGGDKSTQQTDIERAIKISKQV